MKIDTDLNAFIKHLFPLPQRLRVLEAKPQRRRALILAVLLLTSSATVWFWTICLNLVYLFTSFDIRWNVYFGYLVSAILGLQVWGFYHYANTRLASMLFTLTYFLMALSLVLMSGGYHSPSMMVLLSSPVISFRAGGRDEGIMNAIFVGLTALALVVVDKLGIPIVNLMAGMDDAFIFSMSWIVTLSIITTCLVTYDMDE